MEEEKTKENVNEAEDMKYIIVCFVCPSLQGYQSFVNKMFKKELVLWQDQKISLRAAKNLSSCNAT